MKKASPPGPDVSPPLVIHGTAVVTFTQGPSGPEHEAKPLAYRPDSQKFPEYASHHRPPTLIMAGCSIVGSSQAWSRASRGKAVPTSDKPSPASVMPHSWELASPRAFSSLFQ